MSLLKRLEEACAQKEVLQQREKGAMIRHANGAASGAWGHWNNQFYYGQGRRDPLQRAGNPLENSLIFAALNWQATAFQEAPFCVKTVKTDGTEDIVLNHPLTKLIKRPNDFWTRSRFWRATLASRFLNGNAYWIRVRSDYDIVRELWWVHHRSMKPIVPNDGSAFISHYEYTAAGQTQTIPVQDVVHLRYGVDPDFPQLGFSPFRALVSQVATDNEATEYEDILLHNFGVASVVISAKNKDDEIADEDAEKMKRIWVKRTTGGERGMPVILPVPVDLSYPSVSPSDLGIEHVHDHVESRIAMVMQIPPVVLGALVGLKTSTAKASYQESARIAWRHNIIPTQEEITEDIDHSLLGDIGLGNPDTEFSAFDRREVEALQEDRNALHKRTQGDFQTGICDRAEARGKTGYKVRPEDKDVWGKKAKSDSDEDEENDKQEPEKDE